MLLLVSTSAYSQFTPKPTKTRPPYVPPDPTPVIYNPTPTPYVFNPTPTPVPTSTGSVLPTVIIPNGATIRVTIEMSIDGPPVQPWAPLTQWTVRTTDWINGPGCAINLDSRCILNVIKVTPTPNILRNVKPSSKPSKRTKC